MNKLSDDLNVKIVDSGVVLCETRTASLRRTAVLTTEEMQKLVVLYLDGRCPVCFEEIPLNDVVCDECFERAQSRRGGNK